MPVFWGPGPLSEHVGSRAIREAQVRGKLSFTDEGDDFFHFPGTLERRPFDAVGFVKKQMKHRDLGVLEKSSSRTDA